MESVDTVSLLQQEVQSLKEQLAALKQEVIALRLHVIALTNLPVPPVKAAPPWPPSEGNAIVSSSEQ